jgi:hypothetical protein
MTGELRFASYATPLGQLAGLGPPIVWDGRAAVEWWASWTEQGQELTYAGVSLLRFGIHLCTLTVT